jgi:uncharacterized protein
MVERWTFFQLAIETLKAINTPLTPEEIWEHAEELGYRQNVQTHSNTPWNAIRAAIISDIIKNPIETHFSRVDEEKELFFLRGLEYRPEIIKPEVDIQDRKKKKIREINLHPLLSTFVLTNDHFQCVTKTIFASGGMTGKKGFWKWNYPDIIGVHLPLHLHDVAWRIHDIFHGNLIRIYSFELKNSLDYDNLRESFFQAVSNSSWAHEGYLVTASINPDHRFKESLISLSRSFGIGVIILNIKSVFESQILCYADEKNELDHVVINNLVHKNVDFRNFMMNVNQSLAAKALVGDFDKTLSEEELEIYLDQFGLLPSY